MTQPIPEPMTDSHTSNPYDHLTVCAVAFNSWEGGCHAYALGPSLSWSLEQELLGREFGTVVESRLDSDPPQPRLTRQGYTVRSGSPTAWRVRLSASPRVWRRVYVLCFSNSGSLFIRLPERQAMFIDQYDLETTRKETEK